jgi:hypothetical protein
MATPVDQSETRDGWLIVPVGNKWRACRQGTLNAWQLAYGSQLMIFATSRGELDLLLTAEKIRDDMIDMAARLVEGMREAAEQRAQVER